MLTRLRRLLPVVALCALGVAASAPAASAKLVVGVSDNNFYIFA